jgi:uncharacterized protein (DUF2141 family)
MLSKFPLILFLALSAAAAEIEVTVTGLKSTNGQVGCALFASPEGFPMQAKPGMAQWQKAAPGSVTCRFQNVQPGDYAVAVSVDTNGNRRTDTNFLGIPKEDWGVSNNVRPKMRAPRFDEAKFVVNEGAITRLEIQVAR